MERSAKRRQGDQARSMEWGAKRRRTGGNDGTAGGASSTHTSTKGQEVATSSGYDYEVFLSFRGPDTRAGFTDFLYTSLNDAGIRTFRDDEGLRVGEEFAPKLLQAIKQSKISIPIFSKGYASSPWCLKELVQMVECQKNGGQKIMPIFYDVAPSEVRHQTGGYAEAFLSHEEKQRDEVTIHEWKAALSAVGAISGWDLHKETNRREGEFAKEVTKEVFRELKKAYLEVSDCMVGVDNQVDEIMEMIGAQTSETRIIGIHGMGGIGKTTIAKIIYNQLSSNFEDCCFLSNIRETSKCKGIECLQKQLISDILRMKEIDINNVDEGTQNIKERFSNKRVLLLLDDVETESHIDALVGKCDWFGKGSKIIITTRNKDILCVPKVDHRHELKCMDRDQSLQLFSKHAFRRDSPLDEYINQSNRAVGIAGGLPLALEVIGSLLCHTRKELWDATLKRLESVPHDKIQSKLKISYDALDDWQKHIFLDIACLFIGHDIDILVHFWVASRLFPEVDIEVLQSRSLIKITEDNEVWMHDQLRDLGRGIVRQESNMEIKKQSRVWDPAEALDLLRRHEGEKEVKALRLEFDHEGQYCFTHKDFKSLSKLTFLEVGGLEENFCEEETLLWHEPPSNVLPTNGFQENSVLLPQLLWLSWHSIPPTFEITNFSMEIVVILDLSGSEVTHDWKGWSHMEVMKNLKILNLTGCECLERTPNLSAHANLERLILRSCGLVEIDGSICQLKHLVSLDLRGCSGLRRLPYELGGLEALKELRMDETIIENIPNCRGMKNLRIFTLSSSYLFTLPPTFGDLASLEYLSLDNCSSLERLPDSIGNLESLIELDLSITNIIELPGSIGNLKNLKVFKMRGIFKCKMPDSFWTIRKLEEIDVCGVRHMTIGDCISRNQSLRILKLSLANIYAVPRLPESLVILKLSTLLIKTFPDLSNLTNLEELRLQFAEGKSDGNSDGLVEEGPMPQWIGNLSKLESLHLESHYVTSLPKDIILLPRLKSLSFSCPNLRCLPSLPSSLLLLSFSPCKSFCSLEDLSNLKNLSILGISDCAISEIRGLDRLENLQRLSLTKLKLLEILPDLSNLNKLRGLQVFSCDKLVEIQGELPQSLEELEIVMCESLQKLPDRSSLKGLQKNEISHCGKLNVGGISWEVT